MSIKIGDQVCVRAKENNFFNDWNGTIVQVIGEYYIIKDSEGDCFHVHFERIFPMYDDKKGESVVKKHIECAFVNGLPVKHGKVIGYNVIKNTDELRVTLVLSIVQEVFYPHPDTTECLLMVKEEKTIMRAVEGDEHYSSLYMLMMAQEIVKRRVS